MKLFAQPIKYTVANAHAHNDYEHPIPFYTAYHAGFGSIEADIFPVSGNLLVAHHKKDILPKRSLKELYIIPVLKVLSADTLRRIKLLIDIKENYKIALPLLIHELEALKPYLSTPQQSRPLIILISGNRPPPAEYKNYPDFIFFDDDLRLNHKEEEWQRVGLVSLSFKKFSQWNGKGALARTAKKKLKHIIDSVHAAGKPIRFWAAPDNKKSWKLQIKLGVDLIGTDKINELANFFMKKDKGILISFRI